MKKKISFDISYREKVESGEVSVVTRGGEPVKILLWDSGTAWPIVARISDFTFVKQYKENGQRGAESEDDLFLLVEEEDDKLTEFEEACKRAMLNWSYPTEFAIENDFVREQAVEILNAARKALRSEFDEELEKAYKNQDDVIYQRGYEAGFAAGSEIDEERLTDKIAEKIAEKVVKDGNPFVPNPVIPSPGNPNPWTPNTPITPITVMYGVTPTEFRPALDNWTNDAASTESSINEKKE